MGSRAERTWNIVVQICLPFFTLLNFFLTAIKLPQYAVIAGLVSEIFWAYASYRAWKDEQWGIAFTTVIATLIFAFGILNYWYF